mmetsp:Transcript_115517/g.162386  ORF Transcript_115517/g.162386 Transcript_115517/m.162386 type:complete len:86 (-) Transcript_115517:131-388(-)
MPIIGYLQALQSAVSGNAFSGQSPVQRSESVDGAYSLGARRRTSTGQLNVSDTDLKGSMDDSEDELDSQKPGPSFKIGCRRKGLF